MVAIIQVGFSTHPIGGPVLVPLGDTEMSVEACVFRNTANTVRYLPLEQRAKYFREDTGKQEGELGVTGSF